MGREKPFEERRNPFHGGLTAASLLPTSSKGFPQPFFLFKLRIAVFEQVYSDVGKRRGNLNTFNGATKRPDLTNRMRMVKLKNNRFVCAPHRIF
ncbi:hypothetical protein [Methylicorpusculum sp.]|uniref:hypothetical protein n=1 Tax=Methylicorpusculum sp. TaxID=2713644 RepID=UPI00273702B2|nr:hypothetical protein [Methylicorpusculum sp.]MDP2180528.1 hypothetical protein [Methylicorpusculum sp.]